MYLVLRQVSWFSLGFSLSEYVDSLYVPSLLTSYAYCGCFISAPDSYEILRKLITCLLLSKMNSSHYLGSKTRSLMAKILVVFSLREGGKTIQQGEVIEITLCINETRVIGCVGDSHD